MFPTYNYKWAILYIQKKYHSMMLFEKYDYCYPIGI